QPHTKRYGERCRKEHAMASYIIRRVLLMVPVALLVSFVTFMLIHLIPGDPARVLLGEDATPENVAALHRQLGLDKPLFEQYWFCVAQARHGVLAQPIHLNQPVLQAIVQRLPVTLELGPAALLFSLVLALPLGIVTATRRGSRLDWLVNVGSLL